MNEERINEEQSDSTMSDQSKENANTQRRRLLLGAGATGAMAMWHKPVVNAIMLPAHAQMSPEPEPEPTPEELCSMVVLGNVVTGPVSGSNTPPVCSITFDVLSGTAGESLMITNISTSTLPANTTFTIDALGTATDVIGPRIVWQGPAVGAPFCMPFELVDDLTITVTATCTAASGETFSQDFLLSDLI